MYVYIYMYVCIYIYMYILLGSSQHCRRTAELSLASSCDLRTLVSNASSSYLYLEAETYIETCLLYFSRRMLAAHKLRVMRGFRKAGKVDKSSLNIVQICADLLIETARLTLQSLEASYVFV